MGYRLITEKELKRVAPWSEQSVISYLIGIFGFGVFTFYQDNWTFSWKTAATGLIGALVIYAIHVIAISFGCYIRITYHRKRIKQNCNDDSQFSHQQLLDSVIHRLEDLVSSVNDDMPDAKLRDLNDRIPYVQIATKDPVNIGADGPHIEAVREADWLVATSSMSPLSWTDPGFACWLVVHGLVNALDLAKRSHGHLALSGSDDDIKSIRSETTDVCEQLEGRMEVSDAVPFWSMRFIIVDQEFLSRYTSILKTLEYIHLLFRIPCIIITNNTIEDKISKHALGEMRNLQKSTNQTMFPPDIALVRRHNADGSHYLQCWWIDRNGEAKSDHNPVIVAQAKEMFKNLAKLHQHAHRFTDANYSLLTSSLEQPEWCRCSDTCWADGCKSE